MGLLNTAVSIVIMFALYDYTGLGYWGSSASAYVLGSTLSFFLNRRFTFSHDGELLRSALKFSIVIGVSYFTAYGFALPMVGYLFADEGLSDRFVDQMAMCVGLFLFVALNYCGQKFFAFKSSSSKA